MRRWGSKKWALVTAACLCVVAAAYLTGVFAQREASRPRRAGVGAGKVIEVKAGGNLQRALDAAAPGDEVVLEAGATFVGNFVLPAKQGEAFISVRSSRLAQLPEGRRVVPADAPHMARLATPNASPAVAAPPGSHHWRLQGLEITQAGAFATHDLVALGDGDSAGPQKTAERAPHHLVIERSYLHAFDDQTPLKRGVAMNSAHTELLDSHVSGVKAEGLETQAVSCWNGPGPFRVENNYLEAAGINLFFGGAVSATPNLVPSDIVVRRNHLFKPLRWKTGDPSYAGRAWTVKNIFELKSARRVHVEGNVFENNWAHAQSGFAIVLTVGNDSGPWAQVEDVTFTNNLVRNVAQAVNVRARDDVPTSRLRRVTIRNNLFEQVGGHFMQVLRGAEGLTVEHNTALHGGSVVVFDWAAEGELSVGLRFENNVVSHNSYGVFGSGGAIGTAALEKYCRQWVFAGNVVAGADPARYPSNNFYPPALGPGFFRDPARGDYRVAHPRYKGRATDGKDPGCDLDQLAAALSWHTPAP